MESKLDKIGEMSVPIEVVLGRTTQTVSELAKIGEGTVFELNSLAGEPVDIVAAGEVIAKGEVMVIDENFGVCITRVLDNKE